MPIWWCGGSDDLILDCQKALWIATDNSQVVDQLTSRLGSESGVVGGVGVAQSMDSGQGPTTLNPLDDYSVNKNSTTILLVLFQNI